MHPVSWLWERAVRHSHTKVVRVEVWRSGSRLIDELPTDGGSVTWDLGSDLTCEASVSVADHAYLPASPDDALTPYGSSLRVHMGVEYGDRTVETVQVFDGPIVTVPTWTDDGRFTVKATSWLRYVSDDRFLAPYSPTAGASVRTTITSLIQASLPGITVTHVGSDATAPDGLVWEEDRWQAVSDLAGSVGCTVRAQPDGTVLVAPDPSPDGSAVPVRTVDAGAQGVMLTGSRPDLDRAERYNGVVASNPDDPTVWALATLDEGPERWDGPFGHKVLYFSSPLLTAATVVQAAQTRLTNLGGRSRVIEASMVPDPSIQVGDHVKLVWPARPDTPTTIPTETAIVRKIELPIGLGEAKLECRGAPVPGSLR